MKYFSQIFVLAIVSLTLSCNVYYSKNTFLLNSAVREKETVVLDNSYDFYIRQLYVDNEKGDRNVKSFNDKSASDKLIEIEYLFISPQTRNVIYIATRPDMYQKYYADTATYFGENILNAADFRVLFFGKMLEDNSVQFISKNGKNKDIWHLDMINIDNNNFVNLQIIEKYKRGDFVDLIPVDKALDKAISFKKIDNYEIILKPKGKDFVAKNLDNTFHFRQKKKKYEVFLSFSNKDPKKKTNVVFKPRRIQYSPAPLFE